MILLRLLLRMADWLADLAISLVCRLERIVGREEPPVDEVENQTRTARGDGPRWPTLWS